MLFQYVLYVATLIFLSFFFVVYTMGEGKEDSSPVLLLEFGGHSGGGKRGKRARDSPVGKRGDVKKKPKKGSDTVDDDIKVPKTRYNLLFFRCVTVFCF